MESYLDPEAVTVTEAPAPILLVPDLVAKEDNAQIDAVLADGLREINRSHHYRLMLLSAVLGVIAGIVAAFLHR